MGNDISIAGEPGTIGLREDDGGAAAIELALVLPFLLMLFAGSVEFSTGFALQVDLEQASQRAAELALARPPTANDATALAHIRNEAETVSGRSGSNVIVELYRDCITAAGVSTRQNSYPATCPSGNTFADYVRVQIQGTYTRWIDYKRFVGQTSGATRNVIGQAAVRVR